MKKAIIIQGPNSHPTQIKNTYNGMDVIFSTLEGTDTSQFDDTNFIIIKNEIPKIKGTTNFNYQVKNTICGIRKAKELGYDFVFKVRSDITISEIQKLMDLMGEKEDTIYFPAYHNWVGGYLCEHMVYGPTDLMERLWDIPESNLPLPPETQLTKHFLTHLPDVKVDYIFPLLYEYNILAYWEKRHFFLNEYETDKLFTYEQYKT